MGRLSHTEPELESSSFRDQRLTRGQSRMLLSSVGQDHVLNIAGNTRGSQRAMALVRDYAWSTRTERARTSQWSAWLQFCTEDGRSVLPVTEGHFIAFIGWLSDAREQGRRRISSKSVPQYLSAVRQMQAFLIGVPVPDFPFVAHVLRAYGRWEETNFPAEAVRCGISATQVQQVWGLGMSTRVNSELRDCCMVVFAYCLNGLRASSVCSLLSANVEVTGDGISARLSVVKGRLASQQPLVHYARTSASIRSPLDLFLRWQHARGKHVRWFGLPGEPSAHRSSMLTDALQRSFARLEISPPFQGKYSSHSLRIGAHTEQVLLGIPLPVRLARFGWGPHSSEMANLYFDRTIYPTAASYWFFGGLNTSNSVSMGSVEPTANAAQS